MKTILLTGAAGEIAQHLRRELGSRYALRLSDMKAIAPEANETFVQADLADFDQVMHAVQGVDGIVHLGGHSSEASWETIHSANIVGCYHLFEAARRQGVKRVVFASSNHAVGFYRRDQAIDHTAQPKPDTRYGLSKAFGEALGSLYADKYGLEVTCLRIGNVTERPLDVRRLAIWLSPRDFAQLVRIGLEHPDIHYEVLYGMSDNARAWWDNSNATRLGYRPQDRSEDYAAELLARHRPADAASETYQGGTFVVAELGGNPPVDEAP